MTELSLEASKLWNMTQVAHINGGPTWFGYTYMCIDQPRLYRFDIYDRKTKSVTSTFSVDGVDHVDLASAIAALAIPPEVNFAERSLLRRVSVEWMEKVEWQPLGYEELRGLTDKGLLTWAHGRVRLSDAGAKIAKVPARGA